MTILELLGYSIAKELVGCKVGKKNLIHDENPGTVTDIIRAKDINHLSTVADDKWTRNAIIFSHLCGMF